MAHLRSGVFHGFHHTISLISFFAHLLLKTHERFKWEIAVPGGIIPGEWGERNSIGISRLYHECYAAEAFQALRRYSRIIPAAPSCRHGESSQSHVMLRGTERRCFDVN